MVFLNDVEILRKSLSMKNRILLFLFCCSLLPTLYAASTGDKVGLPVDDYDSEPEESSARNLKMRLGRICSADSGYIDTLSKRRPEVSVDWSESIALSGNRKVFISNLEQMFDEEEENKRRFFFKHDRNFYYLDVFFSKAVSLDEISLGALSTVVGPYFEAYFSERDAKSFCVIC